VLANIEELDALAKEFPLLVARKGLRVDAHTITVFSVMTGRMKYIIAAGELKRRGMAC
jgi:hypothetical protein